MRRNGRTARPPINNSEVEDTEGSSQAAAAAADAEDEASPIAVVACNVYVTASGRMALSSSSSSSSSPGSSAPSSGAGSSSAEGRRLLRELCETPKDDEQDERRGRLLVGMLEEAQRSCRELSAATTRWEIAAAAAAAAGGDGPTAEPPPNSMRGRSEAGDPDGSSSSIRSSGDVTGAGVAVAVVHAFCDPIYDRTSFHLVGHADRVAAVAIRLATRALESLGGKRNAGIANANGGEKSSAAEGRKKDDGGDDVHPHPTVGIVDHISVLPLASSDSDVDAGASSSSAAAAWAALQIGHELERTRLGGPARTPPKVLYYGLAHPDRKSLAAVRREETNFFRSARPKSRSKDGATSEPVTAAAAEAAEAEAAGGELEPGVVVVGAPPHFVENWNVRLSNCPRAVAAALTKHVRGLGDTGAGIVEALTLPYAHEQWEVACNVLRSDLVSSQDVDACARAWLQNAAAHDEATSSNGVEIVASYRVGTTAQQCREALRAVAISKEDRDRHDARVVEQFRKYMER
jgi:Formiminotransferase domain, N-terminal subdomain